MIFVTVGTHEQPFNRLIEYVDKMVVNSSISDEVIMQIGYSTYEPKHCTWKKFFSYSEMEYYVSESNIVITHGGPSSFIMPLLLGKTPIVVPRKYEFNEHVNNHQVEFCDAVANREGTIIVVKDIEKLEGIIMNYDIIASKTNKGHNSNNTKFCYELAKIVDSMFMD